MKLLRISAAGGLELARSHLTRPVVTIGRSPTCDVVLRAQGVAPVHFLLEWVGAGAFDPQKGRWSIFDISKSADASGEGVLLGEASQNFRDFTFQWVEDRLEVAPDIGGRIRGALESSGGGGDLLELVRIREDSGSIEEILHLNRHKQGAVLREIPEFKIEWPKAEQELAVRVLLREMPGAIISKRGTRVDEVLSCEVSADDVVQVQWRGHYFYLRFVPAAEVPKVDRKLFQDPVLRNFALVGAGLMALLATVAVFGPARQAQVPKEPPRVARIEVQEIAPTPEPPPPPPPDRQKTPESKPEAAGLKDVAQSNNPGQAAAARFRTSSKGPSRQGLNAPAAQKDVNQLGILGAMAGAAPTPGVRADKIINDGLITQAASGEKAAVVVRNPPAGTAGAAKKSSAGNALTQASTTLRGGEDFNAGSNGPIARVGGKEGYAVGTGLGEGKGLNGGFDFASFDVGAMTVSGGLDRETVRKVIGSYKNQIRTCYEKALLSSAKLSGRVVFKWVITAGGPVASVQITKSEVGSPTLENCVTDVIRGMVFPKAANGNPTTVIYPFVFQSRS